MYTSKGPDGSFIEHEIPTNFVLWSTGISMNPFTSRVSSLLPNQVHKKAIEVDAHLRVKGAPLGDIYAIGDASTVCIMSCRYFLYMLIIIFDTQLETNLVSHLLELVEDADRDKNGRIDFDEWKLMGKSYTPFTILPLINFGQ